ncbi:TetR/AcrR family transcriptional regulator [Fictibacillus phosphorivorans]|uniref:TetR/AcrR family transcriptional regulator n=1 Tax=Fictibacillus phosphorivorans TaxID=1221500 RepID=UPI0020404A25|nr:TetR/AcrR family transcriptional regulator [Fictibacillus phosphorivorans]MCM3776460.1 TetR/AcrR family transcriptional regulator [Fictibacillus phosphorivorans]
MKEGKRKIILKAAYLVFAHKGYENASIKDIASEANITPGLIHYYFKNKEELFLSVQNDLQEKYHKQYVEKSKQDIHLHEVLQEIKSRSKNDPDWYRFRYEIYSMGLKNKEIQMEAAQILKNGRQSLSKPLQMMGGQETNEMASILLACFDGLALQKIMDADFDMDSSYQLLETIITKYLDHKNKR